MKYLQSGGSQRLQFKAYGTKFGSGQDPGIAMDVTTKQIWGFVIPLKHKLEREHALEYLQTLFLKHICGFWSQVSWIFM